MYITFNLNVQSLLCLNKLIWLYFYTIGHKKLYILHMIFSCTGEEDIEELRHQIEEDCLFS